LFLYLIWINHEFKRKDTLLVVESDRVMLGVPKRKAEIRVKTGTSDINLCIRLIVSILLIVLSTFLSHKAAYLSQPNSTACAGIFHSMSSQFPLQRG